MRLAPLLNTLAVASLAHGIPVVEIHALELVEMFIGLHPASHDHFERIIYNIANPHHASYGRHLSRDEVKALLLPPAGASEEVKRWLLSEGVGEGQLVDRGQWLQAHVPMHVARAVSTTPSSLAKRGLDTVPQDVRRHISHAQRAPMSSVGIGTEHKRQAPIHTPNAAHAPTDGFNPDPDMDVCKDTVTPECLYELYNIPDPPAKVNPATRLGIVGFNGQTAQHSELEEFIRRFAPFADGANFTTVPVNGGSNPQGDNYPSGEANLNIQQAVGMAAGLNIRFMSVGGALYDYIPDLDMGPGYGLEDFLMFASFLLDLPDEELPQVVSMSYSMHEQILGAEYCRAACDMFGQLGARGVSVISASGNHGVGSGCQSNDGLNTTTFTVTFPGICPYVTAVGGTELNQPETAWNWTSGGFSRIFDRPEWQDDAVNTYLEKLGDQWKGLYNPDGAAYPDVAAMAWGYQEMNHGAVEVTGGTSAATPVFAAMIALLNNERFNQGKPSMGFLNPWIYSIGNVGFTDITEGKTLGCPGTSYEGLPSPYVADAGWSAVEGWDPTTGFGSPLYDRLKKLACK
ncbi:tripeptidyl-peptidase-like protein [Emericellopsis cladophorae]|uniref:tripeptidyl-peptidase II n=1 Tax=Emericellopsis cladophorae TaxID=2686198 RepID=A0A9P9Y6A0_9HYPO|nr:tripeptidyl-peptidase-like protein [Emericellopsis cladophorae]KAI6784120.1 tripeptidyl-peptidase-like protein [Emericellopsis cladophorae]